MRAIVSCCAVALIASIGTCESPAGDLILISQPRAEYLQSTKRMDLDHLAELEGFKSLNDDDQSLEFSVSVYKLKVGSSPGWSSWGSPPETESAHPYVVSTLDVRHGTFSNKLEIRLSQPTETFGFEIEGNNYHSSYFSVTYFSGDGILGSVDHYVRGAYGARLAAVTSLGLPITSVTIRNTFGDAGGFAMANFRYAPTQGQVSVPEPSTYVLAALGIGLILAIARRDESGGWRSIFRHDGYDPKSAP